MRHAKENSKKNGQNNQKQPPKITILERHWFLVFYIFLNFFIFISIKKDFPSKFKKKHVILDLSYVKQSQPV